MMAPTGCMRSGILKLKFYDLNCEKKHKQISFQHKKKKKKKKKISTRY